jgi:hypothetical protein
MYTYSFTYFTKSFYINRTVKYVLKNQRCQIGTERVTSVLKPLPAGGGFDSLLGGRGRTTAWIVSSMLNPGEAGGATAAAVGVTAGGSPAGAAAGGVAATASLMTTGAILLCIFFWLAVL